MHPVRGAYRLHGRCLQLGDYPARYRSSCDARTQEYSIALAGLVRRP